MRRCVLHIGHPKTATTYLQHCLHLNPDALAGAGFFLPADFTGFGFYDLAALARDGAVMSGNLAPLHALMCDGPGEDVARMHDMLFDAPAGYDVLLSCELFFYYVNATSRVAMAAFNRGFMPEIVAYLPRQDKAAVTAYLQNVRYHGATQGVVDFLVHDSLIPYCQYYRTLVQLRAKLPTTRFRIRTFDPRFLRGGDILTDFLAEIGAHLDQATLARPAESSNQGLVLEQYETLRAATLLGLLTEAERLRAAQQTLDRAERDRLHAYYYRPGLHRFLNDFYLTDNHALLREFLPRASAEEQVFWATFDPPELAPPLDLSRMRHFLDTAARTG
jgi:hypothetical protein